jgi:quinol-cytochrome oxidoreductase complex cytochrome b subunit
MDISDIVFLVIVPLIIAAIQSKFHLSCEACRKIAKNGTNKVDFTSRFVTSSLYVLIATIFPCLTMFECESIQLCQEPNPVTLDPVALGVLIVAIFVLFLLSIYVIKTQVKNTRTKIIIPLILLVIAVFMTIFIILLNIKK